MRRDELRDARELAISGHASGPDAPLRATATALERASHVRSVVLVEGISDQIAVETLASRQGRDLAAEGVVVIPMGGAHSVGRFLDLFGPLGRDLRVSGLCDAAEARHLCHALARAGYLQPATRPELERGHFFVCERDLEDALIRAIGSDALEALLTGQGDLGSFRTLQKQAGWRKAPFVDQVRRFLGEGAQRKLRFAGLLVAAPDVERQPRPLRDLLGRV